MKNENKKSVKAIKDFNVKRREIVDAFVERIKGVEFRVAKKAEALIVKENAVKSLKKI